MRDFCDLEKGTLLSSTTNKKKVKLMIRLVHDLNNPSQQSCWGWQEWRRLTAAAEIRKWKRRGECGDRRNISSAVKSAVSSLGSSKQWFHNSNCILNQWPDICIPLGIRQRGCCEGVALDSAWLSPRAHSSLPRHGGAHTVNSVHTAPPHTPPPVHVPSCLTQLERAVFLWMVSSISQNKTLYLLYQIGIVFSCQCRDPAQAA